MGAAGSAELSSALQAAHAIISVQLERLQQLADQTRQACTQTSSAVRQAERQLDEALIQHRAALHVRQSSQLANRVQELRQRTETLNQELDEQRRAVRQLDQLVRQITMSSAVLTTTVPGDDPWALALRAQVIHGREEERTRLAREVHDGPAQVLANSLMVIETCYMLAQQHESSAPQLLTMLDRLRGATREGLQEVRRFIADLRPGVVHEQGLGEALREYLRGYLQSYPTQAQIEIERLPRLPEDVEIAIYRIAQEALQNVGKYARGVPLLVRLAQHADQIVLTIRDEGAGFDPHEVVRRAGKSNWGLTSMQERAELVGARLVVASRPGHGTEVTVTVPMPR